MKLNTTFLISLAFLISISFSIHAQSSLSLSTGVSVDMNNTNQSFYHIPISFQWKPSSREKAPFFLEFDYDVPLTTKSKGNAYTLNPSLPSEVMLQESIRAYIFTASIGFRIHLYSTKKNNSFYLNLLPLGISNQNYKVTYKNYDKENYEVLNPDVNLNMGGLVMSMAAVYYFHKRKQDMQIMLHAQTPLLRIIDDYPMSYKSIAPLQLTFGYNFYYNKRK
jgi:hypothetical protein